MDIKVEKKDILLSDRVHPLIVKNRTTEDLFLATEYCREASFGLISLNSGDFSVDSKDVYDKRFEYFSGSVTLTQ